MANTKSAKKAIRQINRRSAINRHRRTRIRTVIRRVEEAIIRGDEAQAKEALKAAQPELARGVSRGVLAKNTAARKVARLARRVKTMTPNPAYQR